MIHGVRPVLLVLCMMAPVLAGAQSTAGDQVQAVVIGLHTPQQAHHVDRILRTMEGVLVSRTDQHTSNLFLLLRPGSPVTRDLVLQRLAPMGLEVRCWTRGPRSDAPFHHLDPDQCTALPHQK